MEICVGIPGRLPFVIHRVSSGNNTIVCSTSSEAKTAPNVQNMNLTDLSRFQFRVGNIPEVIDAKGNPVCFVTTAAQTATELAITSGCPNAANRGNFVVIRKIDNAPGMTFEVSEFDAVLTGNILKVISSIKRCLQCGILMRFNNTWLNRYYVFKSYVFK